MFAKIVTNKQWECTTDIREYMAKAGPPPVHTPALLGSAAVLSGSLRRKTLGQLLWIFTSIIWNIVDNT